jgi:hypothetical protein
MEDNNKVTETIETKDKDVQVGTDTTETTEKTEKTFTQAELDEILGKRLAKQKAKFEEEMKNKVSEAERLAKLTEDERTKEEIRIAKEELAKMQAEFNTVKAEFEQQQMLSQVQKELSEKNLPINMAKSLIGKDAETTKANIEKFEVDWKASLQDAIQREIKTNSSSPRTELKGDEGKTKDPKDMSLSEFIEYQKKQQQ